MSWTNRSGDRRKRAAKDGLGILSLGYTIDLWDDPDKAFGDPQQGLVGYEQDISYFALIAHSPRRLNLQPIRLAENFWAYATNAYTPIDSWLRMFFKGLRLAKQHHIDLIQAREALFSGTIGYVLTRWLRMPLHVCVYGTDPFDPYWEKQSWLNRVVAVWAKAILRSADGIQVDGSLTARRLSDQGISRERIVVKPLVPGNLADFVAAERDSSLRTRFSEGGRFRQFALFVGRIDTQKNLRMLVDVASRLAAEYPAIRFIVVGEGPQRLELEQLSRERGLSEVIVWMGPRSHREVVSYMASCDVFVLPSVYEGFARVLMEAAMAGMPIITTAVSGSDDAVVHGKTGYIVPIGDAAAFSSALSELLQDPDRAAEMGRQSRLNVENLVSRYSDSRLQVRIWEDVVSRWNRPGYLKSPS